MIVSDNDQETITFNEYKSMKYSINELKEYNGTYYGEEHQVSYNFETE
jgi:hypothetical protein